MKFRQQLALSFCLLSLHGTVADAAPESASKSAATPQNPSTSTSGNGNTNLHVNPKSATSGSTVLDLSSTLANISVPFLQQHHLSIQLGGKNFVINGSSLLTPAESLAAYQVYSSGHQSIVLGDHGDAIGGNFIIGPKFSNYASTLIIPKGVTAVDMASNVSLSGNFVNAGNFYIASNNAVVSALNITNLSSGLLSSILPSSIYSMGVQPAHSFSLNASNSFANHGAISSAGNLNVSAGVSLTNASAPHSRVVPTISAANNLNIFAQNIINNGAIIRSTNGNVSFANYPYLPQAATKLLQPININNANGLIQALNGSINVGTPLVGNNLDLSGGSWYSNKLNLDAGSTGAILAHVDRISGSVNLTGNSADISNSAGNLTLASINLTGDPIFTSSGDLTISNFNPGFMSDFIALAGGNVNGGAVTINTNGGQIFISAGYQFTPGGAPPPPGGSVNPCSNCTGLFSTNTSVVTTSGASVNLSGSSLQTSSSTDAGSVTVQAPGAINVGSINTTGADATASGVRGGNGGSVQIKAGGAVNTGAINSFGGTGLSLNANDMTMNAGAGGVGGAITINSAGSSITTGNINSSGGAGGGAGFFTGGAGGAAGSITLSAAQLVQSGSLIATGGGAGGSNNIGCDTCIGGNGAGIYAQAGAAITIAGLLNSSGGGGGGAGFGNGGAGGAAGAMSLSTPSFLSISGPVLASGGGGGGPSDAHGKYSGSGGGSFGGGGGGASGPYGGGGGGGFYGGGGPGFGAAGGGSSVAGGAAGPMGGNPFNGTYNAGTPGLAGMGGASGATNTPSYGPAPSTPGGNFGQGGPSPVGSSVNGGNVGQAGGNGSDGTSGGTGNANAVNLQGLTISINNKIGQINGGSAGFSGSPFASNSINASGPGGAVSITTTGVGSSFTVGSVPNGASGSIVATSGIVINGISAGSFVSSGTFPAQSSSSLSSSSTTTTTTSAGNAPLLFSAFPGNFIAGTTIIETDQTPVNTKNSPISGIDLDEMIFLMRAERLATGESPQQVAMFFGKEFNSDQLKDLSRQGLNLGACLQLNRLLLKKGVVFAAPASDIVISTEAGDLYISAGAIVVGMKTDNAFAIYDLHDEHRNSVTLVLNGRSIGLLPGDQLVLAPNQKKQSFAESNPGFKIGYRSLRQFTVENHRQMFLAEFPIVSLLGELIKCRNRSTNIESAFERAKEKILLTAAALQMSTSGHGSYSSIFVGQHNR